jgi:hypothetical protein
VSPTEGVLREAWQLYKQYWRHLLAISFVVYVAVAVINMLLVAVLTWLGALIGVVVTLVGLFWVQGALVTAVSDIRDGRVDLALGETFGKVKPRLPAIASAGILAGIAIAIGLLLLIVPGLLLLTWWAVIVPVIVLEGVSAGSSFSRSRELVRGHGWGVFGVLVLTFLLLLGLTIVLAIVLSPFAEWLQSLVSNIVSGTLTTPFIALVVTLLYYRLRAAETARVPAPQPTAP